MSRIERRAAVRNALDRVEEFADWAGVLLGLVLLLATVSVLRVGMAGRRTMRKWITPSTPVTGGGVNLLASKWVPTR